MTPLPSLQQLRFLSALAEHKHFGRAAAACAVTQSTLSAGLQELEDRLGASLVDRSRGLLRDAEDLADAARGAQEPLSGPLRLGVIPTIGAYFIPGVMPGLAQTFPKLRLYLREEQTASILDKLEKGQLDLALIALPYDTGHPEIMGLGEDPILL